MYLHDCSSLLLIYYYYVLLLLLLFKSCNFKSFRTRVQLNIFDGFRFRKAEKKDIYGGIL